MTERDKRTTLMAACRSCTVSRTRYTIPTASSLMVPRTAKRAWSKSHSLCGDAEELQDGIEPISEGTSVLVVGRSSL